MTGNPPQSALRDLDARAREVFRKLVDSYLETGEPVGSRNLSRLLAHPLSPASVRNVMADLEMAGLIYAPHTSAGRLPTDRGLRFFVDAFLEIGDLTQEERTTIEAQIRAAGTGKTMQAVLTEASQLLSGLSAGAGVVLAAKHDMRLKHVEFVRIEPARGLVVLVAENGVVENRLIDLPADLPASALIEASNYINHFIRGRTLAETQADIEFRAAQKRQELDLLARQLVEAGLASWTSVPGDRTGTLIIRGHANLLDNVRAVEDLERIRTLFADLETDQDLIQLLGLANAGEGVRIFIGSENKLFSLSGSSLVAAPYHDAEQKVIGAVGVIGPTRLNYARVVPMVDYTAKVVTRLLGR